MRVTVVVTVPDRAADVERTLRALRDLVAGGDWPDTDLVVAADGCAADPLRAAARFRVRVVRVPGFCGAEALRQAARHAVSRRHVLFVEAGSSPTAGDLRRALAGTGENPGRALVLAPPGPLARLRRAYSSGIRFLLASSH
jgi:hypothetical protein